MVSRVDSIEGERKGGKIEMREDICTHTKTRNVSTALEAGGKEAG